MKILQVIHGYPMRYNAGSEVYTQNLVHGLVRNGHELFVFSRIENPFIPNFTIKKEFDVVKTNEGNVEVPIYLINVAGQKDRYQTDAVDDAFSEILGAIKPDIVHFQHLNHLSIGLLNVVKMHEIPAVFTLHDFWLACPRGQFIQVNYGFDENWVMCDGQEDEKCASHCYSRYFTGITNEEASLDLAYWTKWVKIRRLKLEQMLPYVSYFIAPSKWLKRRMEKELPFIKGKTIYLDYGFHLDRFTGRKRIKEDKFVFGYIGTHIVTKGIHLLIDAFSKLDIPAVLRIWGRPRSETTPYLKEKIKEIEMPSFLEVEWMGEYSNEEIVSNVFNHVDALVVPSIWDENSPLVIHEALQVRIPIITSDHGGMGEYVKDGVNGFNFVHRDVQSLTNKMRWVATHFEEAKKIAERGYLYSEDGNIPSIESHVKEIEKIYQKSLGVKNE